MLLEVKYDQQFLSRRNIYNGQQYCVSRFCHMKVGLLPNADAAS